MSALATGLMYQKPRALSSDLGRGGGPFEIAG